MDYEQKTERPQMLSTNEGTTHLTGKRSGSSAPVTWPSRLSKREAVHALVFEYGILLLAVVLPCSPSATTWVILALSLNWFLEGHLLVKLRTACKNPLVLLCVLFYLWEVTGLLYTAHFAEGLLHTEKEASLLVLPLLLFSYPERSGRLIGKMFVCFQISMILVSLFCLYHAFRMYGLTGDTSYFFYHTLVSPVHQHAVYFSIYTFICLAWLFRDLKQRRSPGKVVTALLMMLFFSGLLFLLRSKMVVGVMLAYAIFHFIRTFRKPRPHALRLAVITTILLGVLIALTTANPLSRQMDRMRSSDLNVLKAPYFNEDDYFDEFQLRLILWKFSLEILRETHQWLTGVSPGDTQYLINRQVISHHMYTGVPGKDRGYLDYNMHNQFLETLLRSGILGLILLLAILYWVGRLVVLRRDEVLGAVLAVFACVFLTESVLEREIGIVPFLFFICLLAAGAPTAGPPRPRQKLII